MGVVPFLGSRLPGCAELLLTVSSAGGVGGEREVGREQRRSCGEDCW